ncbi:MAG: ribosome small subunit-dependent GTPase A [Candidatus Dormibacteria bacterium]
MTADSQDDSTVLADLGWDEARAVELAELAVPQGEVGRVSRVDRAVCTVLGPHPQRVRYGSHGVATGDWVVAAPGTLAADLLQVRSVLTRRSTFSRLGSGERAQEQVVATNVDVVLLAQALDRELNLHSLQRYLTLAWNSGAQPVVVLTKADCRSREETTESVRRATEAAAAAPVLAVSTVTGAGITELTDRWLRRGRTLALVGPSGAGKSTLVNRIIGAEAMATAEVRADGKGRHTTTHRELLVVPGRGILLDTPGMRGLGLWGSADGLERTFPDLELLAAACRFRDCAHDREPGCAVTAAIRAGTISSDRLESWRKLDREQLSVAARQGDLSLQRQERERWKGLTKQNRQGR